MRYFVIYDHPSDYPQHFVVRGWSLESQTPDKDPAGLANTIEEARAIVQKCDPGLVCLHRNVEDDPVIVETWL